jgi:hypothetical protein
LIKIASEGISVFGLENLGFKAPPCACLPVGRGGVLYVSDPSNDDGTRETQHGRDEIEWERISLRKYSTLI